MTCPGCAKASEPRSDSDTGPIDEQAQLLAQSLASWLRAAAGRLGGELHVNPCEGCPVCRLISRTRQDDPALVKGLADVITVAATGLASLWGSVAHARPGESTSDGPPPADTSVRVRKIKVRDGNDA